MITAAEIAEKFDISKRTAYRDMKALEDAGIPIFVEEGKGYSLMEGYTLPPVMFTEEEANALITAESLISRNKDKSLIENHKNAITKVRAVLRYASKDKTQLLSERLFFMKNFSEETTSNCLSTIQLAVTNLKLIKIKYLSLKEESSIRTIEPQAVYHTSENWIMIGWCHLRKAYREFRLDRIQTIEVLSDSFEKRDFDMKVYFLS